MRVISLGWGVQSWGLAAMSACGVLPRADAAVFADTGFEKESTYEFAERWGKWLEERGIHVVTVRNERASGKAIDEWGGVFIPAYTRTGPGKRGMLRRQCTYDWKIAPIRRWLRKNRDGHVVELWIGLTVEEAARRMRKSDVGYIKHRWPYIEPELWDGRRLTRWDVTRWLKDNLGPEALPSAPKSACYFCPFHSRSDWRWMRQSSGDDWRKAVEFDNVIRDKRPPQPLYLVQDCVPLENIILEENQGQGTLWDEEECDGYCGL